MPNETGAAETPLLHVTDTAVSTMVPGDVPKRFTATPTGAPGAGTAQRGLEFLAGIRRIDWAA